MSAAASPLPMPAAAPDDEAPPAAAPAAPQAEGSEAAVAPAASADQRSGDIETVGTIRTGGTGFSGAFEVAPVGADDWLGLFAVSAGPELDAMASRAEAAGGHVLQAPANKPHGLRECVILDADGYAWVPSRGLQAADEAQVDASQA